MTEARRSLAEVLVLGLVLGLAGGARLWIGLDRALLPGEGYPALALELACPLLLGLVALLLGGRRVLRPDAVGAGVAAVVLLGLQGLAAGWMPRAGAGLAALLFLPLLARFLLKRWPPVHWPWLHLALLLVALLPAGLDWPRRAGPPPPAAPGAERLVLVTLDTFRADHLGRIGGAFLPVTTPALDALADQGLLFTAGVAPVALTLPSHTSMLTGQLPDEVGVVRNGQRVQAEAETVAQALSAQGWRTGAFLSAAVLGRHGGLDRGFHHYDDVLAPDQLWRRGLLGRALSRLGALDKPASQRRGDQTLARALAWLQQQPDQKTFLWLHLYDPHAPYDPPAPWDRAYDPATPGLPGGPEDVARIRKGMRVDAPMTLDPGPRDLRPSIAAYAGEISFTDSLVGQLLAALPPDATVLVAADHGESLGEHNYMLNHGWLVHEPSVRVPILLRAPGVPAGLVIDQPTPLSAIAPTLRVLAGLPGTGTLMERVRNPPQGEVLRSFGGTQQSRSIMTLHRRKRVAFRLGPLKWVVDDKGRVQRFDLASDPGELAGVDGEEPERSTWKARGEEVIEVIEAVGKGGTAATGEDLEALRALGYVE